MFEAVIAILTGGATGLLGTLISSGVSFFERRQRNKHELELRRIDLEVTRAESEGAERVAAIEAESARDQAELAALAASHRSEAVRWSSGDSKWLVFVDVVRGLMRPALTAASLAAVTVIYFTLSSPAPTVDVAVRIIDALIYLATTTTLWWFGTRPKRASK